MDINEIIRDPLCLKNKLNKAISDDDQMFTGKVPRYFGVGADAILKICNLLNLSRSKTPEKILDFACGYGRVARYLSAAFPSSELVVSDVMQGAIDFCEKEFNATPFLSKHSFPDIDLNKQFSLIWSGSLMTHLDEDKAIELLEFFERHLAFDGIVVFTVHGRSVSRKWGEEAEAIELKDADSKELSNLFDHGKYAYSDYKHMTGYGLSLTPLYWLVNQLDKLPNLRIVSLTERGWDNHQDIIALQKKPIDEPWKDTNPQF